MVGKKKICILTGAGISAASGIPTFRGQDGFWKEKKRYADEDDPMKVLTMKFFREHAWAVWEWHYDFERNFSEKQANAGHAAILEFQEHCILT